MRVMKTATSPVRRTPLEQSVGLWLDLGNYFTTLERACVARGFGPEQLTPRQIAIIAGAPSVDALNELEGYRAFEAGWYARDVDRMRRRERMRNRVFQFPLASLGSSWKPGWRALYPYLTPADRGKIAWGFGPDTLTKDDLLRIMDRSARQIFRLVDFQKYKDECMEPRPVVTKRRGRLGQDILPFPPPLPDKKPNIA